MNDTAAVVKSEYTYIYVVYIYIYMYTLIYKFTLYTAETRPRNNTILMHFYMRGQISNSELDSRGLTTSAASEQQHKHM